MKEYVHSFTIKVQLTREEHDSLLNTRRFSFDSNKSEYELMTDYLDSRIMIEGDSLVRLMPKIILNSMYELKIVVTVANLLNHYRIIGGCTDQSEMENACKTLDEIIKRIEELLDVNLLERTELFQVNLAKDIITPNEFYAQEVIKATQNAFDFYGFQKINLIDDFAHQKENNEGEDVIVIFCEDISGEIYRVKRKLILYGSQSEIVRLGNYGLLRFMLPLDADTLMNDYSTKKYICSGLLSKLLYQITVDGNMLFNKYFGNFFYDGAMLSRKVLKKYLKINCEKNLKNKRIKEMIDLSDWITKMGPVDLMLFAPRDEISTKLEEFKNIKISPVYVNKRCPYIPSFSDMINDTINDE